MDENNPLPGRHTHKLNIDSQQQQQRQEQQRLERQQYQRQKQQKRKRKQQKRKAKQQEERAVQEAAQKKAEERKKQLQIYNDPAKLFQADSDSGVSFSRLKRKINVMYPRYARKIKSDQSSDQQQSEQQQSEQEQSEQSESEQQSQSQQQSSRKKKSKKNKKAQKKRVQQSDSQQRQQRKKMKSAVKIEPQMSGKDKLVQEVAVRWNYALPDWPPIDYDYQGQLKKRGYRAVQSSKFKFVDEIVDGLVKVYQLDGYKGVYRGKNIIIDVRPKQECPSLNYFYSKSEEQLTKLLKIALQKQLQLLQQVQFKQIAELKLLEDLKRRVKQLQK